MKTSKLLALGLVSFTALGLATQSTQAAAIDGDGVDAKTTGKVTFSTSTDIEIPNPDGPGTLVPEEHPGGGSNTKDPNLQIKYVPNFIFGETVDGTFKENVKYNSSLGNDFVAMNQLAKVKEDGKADKTVEMDNFAQIWNSDLIKDWTLTVKAEAFTTGTKTQPKMLISLNNVTAVTGNAQFGTIAEVGATAKELTNSDVVIGTYKAGASEDGALNTFMFGEDTVEGKAGVTLNVPQGLNIENNETYTSNLTWTVKTGVK